MTAPGKNPFWILGGAYILLVLYLAFDVRASSEIRARRLAEFGVYTNLYESIRLPDRPVGGVPSEPLLIRLQKSVARPELKDRAKLASGAPAPGLPPSVSLTMEGVSFDQIASILEDLSSDAGLAVTSFKIERAGGSDVRFDFSAAFSESPR